MAKRIASVIATHTPHRDGSLVESFVARLGDSAAGGSPSEHVVARDVASSVIDIAVRTTGA